MKSFAKGLLGLLVFLIQPVFLMSEQSSREQPSTEKHSTAIFAGGCFWCSQEAFDDLKGVVSTTVGYTGGRIENPTYEKVSHEDTGHYESVKVVFDPAIISYRELLNIFWRNIDPFDEGGQFCDRGLSYGAVIFYTNESQKNEALASKAEMEKLLKQPIVTKIVPASTFYDAEDYHQEYHQKNPIRYKFYRFTCGRDQRLKAIWKE